MHACDAIGNIFKLNLFFRFFGRTLGGQFLFNIWGLWGRGERKNREKIFPTDNGHLFHDKAMINNFIVYNILKNSCIS